jgi:glycosyltransferase involved in cell wall biosynthesis
MLTVVFSTLNGARTLPRMLTSLERVKAPPGDWALVAVDNGSTDDTYAILESFRQRLPLEIVREPRPGKNRALNVARPSWRGDLIVFTDDDIEGDPGWLVALRAAADAQRDYSIFGGMIRPIWPRAPDRWILEWVDLAVCYTVTDTGQPEGPVAANLVWGPNMAIRADALGAEIWFDEEVGPRGRDYAMGSETDLSLRLAAGGHRAWFCRQAIVGHLIRPEQMTRAWVLGRATRFGRGMYRRNLHSLAAPPPLLLGVPRYLVRMILEGWLRYLRAVPYPRARFAARWHLNYLLGCVQEARRHFRTS